MDKKSLTGKIKYIQGMSLSVKIYILIIVIIVTVSAALVYTGYNTFSNEVDEEYNAKTRSAMAAAEDFLTVDIVEQIWNTIHSDEYLQAKAEAEAANDEDILVRWMSDQPAYMLSILLEADQSLDQEKVQFASMYDEYHTLIRMCNQIRDVCGVMDAYIQMTVDGVTYNLIDPDENIYYMGSIEEPIKEFAQYGDNEYIPPTVYRSEYGWLCTSCQPIGQEGRFVCMFCVDIDMNKVMQERDRFLAKSLGFVLLEIAAAIIISMVLIRRSITRPLKLLTKATRGFVDNDENISGQNIIQLPIRSRDEIGTLYHEIQSMQGRIVDYTDHITRITAAEEHIRTEMGLAARIQNSALPKNFQLPTSAVELYALMIPARTVGGDFYDFFLSGDRLYLVIADVSGKGVPASMFMMRAKTAIKFEAGAEQDPVELLRRVNNSLYEENDESMFVTVWLGILDLKTGVMRCCNAGHEYPMVMHAGGDYELLKDKHGIALGIFEDSRRTGYEIRLNPGDRIFVYTDGAAEAMNENEELYGLDRLREQLNQQKDSDQKALLEGVLQGINHFAGAVEQFDDITMLGLTYKGSD